MWRDLRFGAALAAAPLFWALLFAYTQPSVAWDWPLREPWVFLSFALIYPVAEEVVFRGGLQTLLRRHLAPVSLGPITLANLLTSIAFSCAHLVYRSPLTALLVFVPSLIFGYFRDRHDRLASPIVLHVFYNAGYFWLFGA